MKGCYIMLREAPRVITTTSAHGDVVSFPPPAPVAMIPQHNSLSPPTLCMFERQFSGTNFLDTILFVAASVFEPRWPCWALLLFRRVYCQKVFSLGWLAYRNLKWNRLHYFRTAVFLIHDVVEKLLRFVTCRLWSTKLALVCIVISLSS